MKDKEKDIANTKLHLVKGTKTDEEKGSKQDVSEEKKSGKLRLREMLEVEEDDDIWEEDEDEEKERPWMLVVTFLGLAVLAAVICVILWYFTHPGKAEEGSENMTSDVSGVFESGEDSSAGRPGDEEETDSGQTWGDGEDSAPDVSAEQPAGAGEEEQPEYDTGAITENREEAADQGVDGSESAELPEGQEQEPVSGTGAMKFKEQQESVTPKDVVNLRSVPTTADEGNIVVQCRNGEILTRTGMNNDTGWSRLDYEGQTLYAVTQYLTTDLEYKPPVQASDPNRVSTVSGRVIVFSNCDDWISPKEYVNLRTEPSTDQGNDTVSCRLEYGEKAHRTGYSTDSGWSRVEYDGKVLYVVTSLIYVVEPE